MVENMEVVDKKKPKVAVCCNLSHLIHRLHNAMDSRHKFILATQISNFEESFRNEKTTTLRLIMALDPEFVFILLRSSTIFATIALQLSNKLLWNKETALHMSDIVPYVAHLISKIVSRDDFIMDSTTRLICNKLGYGLDYMRTILVNESLKCLKNIGIRLGMDKILSINFYPLEIGESVDDLSRDMFDLAPCELSVDSALSPSLKLPKLFCDDSSCVLCEKVRQKDYKDEAIILEELFRDLDALLQAHLEDKRIRSDKSADGYTPDNIESDLDFDMGSLLEKLGVQIIADVEMCNELNASKELTFSHLSSLKMIFELLPKERFSFVLHQCINSKSFDILRLLMELASDGVPSFSDKNAARAIASFAIKLLDRKINKSNASYILNFLQASFQHHGLEIFEGSKFVDHAVTIIKRAEIEIHSSLYNFFRLNSTENDVSCAFRILETVIVAISEFESHTTLSPDIFSTIHRIISNLFDFYEQIDDSNVENARSYISCCSRLVGCWMTLEPLHLQNSYIRTLPKMLAVMSDMDFTWILPTFDYIEICDVSNVEKLLSRLLRVFSKIISPGAFKETDETIREHFGNNTISMVCRIIERVFLDGVSDCTVMISALDIFEIHGLGKVVAERGLGDSLTTDRPFFIPQISPEILLPLPLEFSAKTSLEGNFRFLTLVLEKLFLTELSKGHSQIKFIGDILRAIDKGQPHMGFENFLTTLSLNDNELYVSLCEISLATAAACLCRIKEDLSIKFMDFNTFSLIIECVIFCFFRTAPKKSDDYTRKYDERINLWYRFGYISVLLIQNYPTFARLLVNSVRKTKLRLPPVNVAEMESALNEQLITRQDIELADFFYTFILSLK